MELSFKKHLQMKTPEILYFELKWSVYNPIPCIWLHLLEFTNFTAFNINMQLTLFIFFTFETKVIIIRRKFSLVSTIVRFFYEVCQNKTEKNRVVVILVCHLAFTCYLYIIVINFPEYEIFKMFEKSWWNELIDAFSFISEEPLLESRVYSKIAIYYVIYHFIFFLISEMINTI